MGASVETLERFVRAPAPGFRCSAAGDRSGRRFLARIEHVLHVPASAESIAQIQDMLGDYAQQIAAFYSRHDGFVLYQDLLSDAAGIELFPVAGWEEATQDMKEMFGYLTEDPDSDPDHILTGVAIATVPHSGNYFVMPVTGPTAGKIFYADHDGWYESAFADDFDDFLARLTRDPVQLLVEEVGCYTRYSDDKTDAQWIPEEYFPDVRRIT